jgi:hypothetical protein
MKRKAGAKIGAQLTPSIFITIHSCMGQFVNSKTGIVTLEAREAISIHRSPAFYLTRIISQSPPTLYSRGMATGLAEFSGHPLGMARLLI